MLLISEDLDEVLALADRIVVMYEGAIVGERRRAHGDDVDELGLLMAGGAVSRPTVRIERRLVSAAWLLGRRPARLARSSRSA